MNACRRCGRVRFLMSETNVNICTECEVEDARPKLGPIDDKALNMGEIGIRAMYNEWKQPQGRAQWRTW